MNDLKKQSDKLMTIQQFLASGMNRGEVALKLGYSGWRSLDIYMRRNGMRWNGTFNKYIDEEELQMATEPNNLADTDVPAKIAKIITLYDDINADPKQIAKQTGFGDHIQMANYMSSKGYLWSNEVNNYVKAADPNREIVSCESNSTGLKSEKLDDNRFTGTELDRYIRLMDTLVKHEDRLMELLLPEVYSRTIPRYFVPGITRTKSFYMSDSLSKLLNEFCSSKNLSQKEVIEAALVEFLSKYSFKKEVDTLIRYK